VEKRGLEIAGLESRSGLITGDFTGNSGHEGRRAWQGALNVRSSAFHEGRGAGKKTTPGGHDLVNRKKLFQEKEELREVGTDMLRARSRWSSASSLKP
jgi:hypothetical protein